MPSTAPIIEILIVENNGANGTMSAEGEVDMLVYETFFSRENTPGVIIEVGAAHPEFLSIGAGFRSRNWKVVSIEANPVFCKMHRSRNFKIYQYACGAYDKDNVDFYVVDSKGGEYLGGSVTYESFSSLGINNEFRELFKGVASEREVSKIQVNKRRLDTILRNHEPHLKSIDVLAIDVEGWELAVLDGLTFKDYEPKVVILENLFGLDSYRDYMKIRGYHHWKTSNPNDIYISPQLAQTFDVIAT